MGLGREVLALQAARDFFMLGRFEDLLFVDEHADIGGWQLVANQSYVYGKTFPTASVCPIKEGGHEMWIIPEHLGHPP